MAATKNYNELCRLCASNLNLLIGIDIFDAEGSVREINKKILSCLPIQIHEADSLPKRICEECVYKLDLFCTFREKSIETESLLIKLLQKDKLHIVEKEPKILVDQQQTMDIVTTINNHHQQLHIVENSQDLLDHTNLSLNHTLTARHNILVTSEIGLNHDLESIEITASDLNSHGISHDNLSSQQLSLHHESTMVQLVQQEMHNMTNSHLSVQHLDILHHSPHNILTGQYDLQDKSMESDQNIADQQSLLIIKADEDLFVKVENEIKSENHNDLNIVKTAFSDASVSDSDDSIDLDANNDVSSVENSKTDDLIIENTLYVDPLHLESNSSQQILSSGRSEYTSFYCNTCGVTVKSKDDYLEHCGEHLKKCLICQTEFTTLEELYLHRNKIHPRSSPNQKIEGQPIATHKSAKKDQIDENFFKDESSDEDGGLLPVNSNESLNKGEESGENEDKKGSKRKSWKLKECSECGKTYKTNYKLAEHMRKHTGEQPFKCRMCDKAFRSKIGLAQHEAKHIGHFEYACPTCGKGFQCKSYLIVHQRAHSTEKPYHCSTCSRNFKTKQSLVDHENRHLGVKPFMCDICGRGFITKGLCKSHQKVHSGRDNRQFPCLVCNKLFVSKSYLNTHAKIHTGEKPFICEVCGKGFLTRVDLKIHSTMHTGEKSFVCEMCGKAFARRDALRCHRRSHTGERPYRCDVCGQTFTQFSPMAIHKRIHTGERPYACDVCPKTFISRSTMMSHKKKHSPTEMPLFREEDC